MMRLTLLWAIFLQQTAVGLEKPEYQPLEASSLVKVTWSESLRVAEHENCLSSNVRYSRLFPTDTKYLWRIPHSTITMDGKRCGSQPANATDEMLEGDSWTDLFAYELVSTRRKASRAQLTSAYLELTSKVHPVADVLAALKRALGDDIARKHVFIAREGDRARVCNDIRVPLETFTILARVGSQSLDASRFLRGITGASFRLEAQTAYHITFVPVKKGQHRFCPYVVKAQARTYPIRQCLPGDAMVRTTEGDIRIDEVKIGDWVAYVDTHGKKKYSPVLMFTHRDPDWEGEFVEITMEGGEVLSITAGHFIDEILTARDVERGDRIRIANGCWAVVNSVERVTKKGLYNIQTAAGTMVVDGVVISAYTESFRPSAAHAALAPVRAMARVSFEKVVDFLAQLVIDSIESAHAASKQRIMCRRAMCWKISAIQSA